MATYWTLECGGVEKSFADWGISMEGSELLFTSMGMDVFSAVIPGARIEDDPVFGFEASVIVRSGRTFAGGIYGGGVIEFQGKRLTHLVDGQPHYEGVAYKFGGPWYDISQTAYAQKVYFYAGDPVNLAVQYVTDVVLFQRVNTQGYVERRNNGQQIGDVLQSVLDQYTAQGLAAPFQIGTIDPAVNLPTYPSRDIRCDEAIQHCLRCSPNAKVYFDYSVQPPRIHVRSMANCTPFSIALGDGVKHESIRLTPRYDMQARAVVIHFKQLNQANDYVWVQDTKQKAPANGPEGGLRVLVQTVDLGGSSITNVTGSLRCAPATLDATWWRAYVPEINNTRVQGLTFLPDPVTIIEDGTGTPVSLVDFPNILDDGCGVADWMRLDNGTPVTCKKVTIRAYVKYDQCDSAGVPRERFERKELVARVTLTNGVTRNYTALASGADAEEVPVNMAQDIYNALAVLQYEGVVTIVEPEAATAIGMGNALNLTGGRAEWATMKALIQSVRKQLGVGRTEVTVGPARFLSAGDLTQLFLINRNRRVFTNPIINATAQLTNGVVGLGKNTPRENTSSGMAERSLMVMAADAGSGNKAQAVSDATNKKIVLQVVNGTGTRVDAQGWMEIALADLLGKGLKVREWDVCDANGATKKALFLSSDPYTP